MSTRGLETLRNMRERFPGKSTIVVGHGKLADALIRRLNITGTPPTLVSDPIGESSTLLPSSLVVYCADGRDVESRRRSLYDFRKKGFKILPVLGRMSQVFIGPLEVPGRTGCTDCLEIRWQGAARRIPWIAALNAQFENGRSVSMPISLTEEALHLLAETVALEIRDILHGGRFQTNGRIGVVDRDGEVSWKRFIPASECPRCSLLSHECSKPQKDYQRDYRSHSLQERDDFRVRKVNLETLTRLYVDPDIGFVSSLELVMDSPPYVGVNARTFSNGRMISGFGLGENFKQASKTAIFEVLERHCAMSKVGHGVLWGTYSELKGCAIHPDKFGLYDDVAYGMRQDISPFNETEKYSWVEAVSCLTHQSSLVSRQLVYATTLQGESRFVYESSNGWAVGTTKEEAILHAILEIVERDSFLNTWYGMIPIPEIIYDTKDCSTRDMLRWFDREGYSVRFFNMAFDLGIPSILAVAINSKGELPLVVCSSAAHLRSDCAVRSALRELIAQVLALVSLFRNNVKEMRRKYDGPHKIVRIRDHSAAASLPENYSHWSFLLDRDAETVGSRITAGATSQLTKDRFLLESGDLHVILQRVLHHFHNLGFEVYMVDGTSLELKSAKLHAVKVLIPGMIPLSFGYGMRRVKGMERVLRLPFQLGYTSAPLALDSLNSNPHPFS